MQRIVNILSQYIQLFIILIEITAINKQDSTNTIKINCYIQAILKSLSFKMNI